jgi:NADH-quinone oxidoreductase subunit G/[NiFe] hydrogenase diaphorase moiety small subunit
MSAEARGERTDGETMENTRDNIRKDSASRAPESQVGRSIAPPADDAQIGARVTAVIDGQPVTVPLGTTIVEAARRVGVVIPTLCAHPDLCVAGMCRVCVVEVEGQRTLQAACAYPIHQPLRIRTHSAKVRLARRHIVELLLSKHAGECTTCVRNRDCELQVVARAVGIDTARFGHPKTPRFEVDASSRSVIRDMNKCILCRRCVRTCLDLQEVGALEAVERGDRTRITTYLDKPLADVVCINCGQCINRCPTGALHANDPTSAVWAAISDPKKHVVIQTAPAPRAGIGEEFGLPPGTPLTWQMNSALRRIGFDRVFDTNFTADLTIIEEGTELVLRLYKNLVGGDATQPLPQFTSCSPGWVKYIEHFYPAYLPHVSTAKSPQQMFGALMKTWYADRNGIDPADVVSVALMPCSAKKFECDRPEMTASGHKDVDFGLTTRELAQMMREAGIHLPDLPKSDFDDPFGTASGSGVIFAATGGVMEAALRSVLEFVTGRKVEDFYAHADVIPLRGFEGCRYVELKIPQAVGPVPALIAHLVPDWKWLAGATLKLGVAHGTANARKVLEDIKAGGPFSQCHFIEFMACPGGCLGGGGQPIPTSPEIRAARARAIYAEDAAYGEAGKVRKSHENPAVLHLYGDFLTDGPCGKLSHRLLHTHYTPRGTWIE